MNKKDKIVVGISLGDVNGVGIEIILKTFDDQRMFEFCTPVLFGNSNVISIHKKILNLETKVYEIDTLDQLNHGKINLLKVWKENTKIEIGKSTKIGGQYAFKSLEVATTKLFNQKTSIFLAIQNF